jgi:hypothetical protein
MTDGDLLNEESVQRRLDAILARLDAVRRPR